MPRAEPPSDKAILQKVNQHLGRISLGPRSRVVVTVRNGQVTLSGNIQYETQRRPALKAANSVDGVRAVLDQLCVPPHKPYSPPRPPRAAPPEASELVPPEVESHD